MALQCIYHPTQLSHFLCTKCNKSFCRECISKREGGYIKSETLYFCPVCNVPAKWIGASNTLVPFWNRLHRLFLYPFYPHSIILLIVLAFASQFFSAPGLINSSIRFILWAFMLKYSYAALSSTARGNLTPPAIDADMITGDFKLVYKQIILFAILYIGGGFIFVNLGMIGIGLYVVFLLFFLPAIIIVLVSTENIKHALNPVLFINLAIRIGWAYLLMYFFLFLLLSAPAAIVAFTMPLLPSWSQILAKTFFENYYTLIAYHLMGYVLLQYHEQIGYQIEIDDFVDKSSPSSGPKTSPSDGLLEQVNILVKEGKHDEAIDFIHQSIEKDGLTNITVAERYYTLLKIKKDTEKLLEHAPYYLNMAANQNLQKKACEVYQDCKALDPDFLPQPDAFFKVAGWLNSSGNTNDAILAYSSFIKNFPESPNVPMAYFRMAQIYYDRLMDAQKAKHVLDLIADEFPNHEIMGMVNNYKKQMAM